MIVIFDNDQHAGIMWRCDGVSGSEDHLVVSSVSGGLW